MISNANPTAPINVMSGFNSRNECGISAMVPSNARQAHMEMADVPLLDVGGYVMLARKGTPPAIAAPSGRPNAAGVAIRAEAGGLPYNRG